MKQISPLSRSYLSKDGWVIYSTSSPIQRAKMKMTRRIDLNKSHVDWRFNRECYVDRNKSLLVINTNI